MVIRENYYKGWESLNITVITVNLYHYGYQGFNSLHIDAYRLDG